MRKSKPARHSRLVRKWDGTPVVPLESTPDPTPESVENSSKSKATSKPGRPAELFFDFETTEQLTDTLEH